MRNVTPRSGSLAFGGLLAFILVVYANPGNWFEGMEDIGFAKIAAGFAVVALAGSWLLQGRKLTLGGWPGLALCGLFAIVGFSAIWSYWPGETVKAFGENIKFLAICLVAANVIDSRPRLHRAISALACATLIPAVGCITSWMRGEHLVDGDRAAWIGLFANPNELAYYLVVGVAMILAAREATHRRWLKLTYLAMLVPVGVAIQLTQSRGGMIAAGAVLLLWVLRSVKRAPALVGVALALGCVLALGPADPFSRRMESSMSHGEDMSARGRVDAWRTGLAIAADRPWTGVGAGAFVVAWPDYAPGDAGAARTEHNTFIQLIGELGIPALLLFVIALVAGVLGISRAARDPRLAPYARGVQCGLAGFAVCSLWGGIAFTWPVYLLLGFSLAAARLARSEPVAIAEAQIDTEPMPLFGAR
jgi:O-antigen ligase